MNKTVFMLLMLAAAFVRAADINLELKNVKVVQVIDDQGATELVDVVVTNAVLTATQTTEFVIDVYVNSSAGFDGIQFDLFWDGPAQLVLEDGKAKKDDGDLFSGADYDLVANAFVDENRVFVSKALRNPGTVDASNADYVIATLYINVDVEGSVARVWIDVR